MVVSYTSAAYGTGNTVHSSGWLIGAPLLSSCQSHFSSTEWAHQTQNNCYENINIHDGLLLFFMLSLFCTVRTVWVSCESLGNLQFDSFVLQDTNLKVACFCWCHCNSSSFPHLYSTSSANSCTATHNVCTVCHMVVVYTSVYHGCFFF